MLFFSGRESHDPHAPSNGIVMMGKGTAVGLQCGRLAYGQFVSRPYSGISLHSILMVCFHPLNPLEIPTMDSGLHPVESSVNTLGGIYRHGVNTSVQTSVNTLAISQRGVNTFGISPFSVNTPVDFIRCKYPMECSVNTLVISPFSVNTLVISQRSVNTPAVFHWCKYLRHFTGSVNTFGISLVV